MRSPWISLPPTEHSARMWDGTELFYRAWQPVGPSDQAILLFHRGHEHSGRLVELANSLGVENTWLFAWDARGHGRSPGMRGWAGHFQDLVRDVESFVRHISSTYGIPVENMIPVAHSVGGVVVTAWVHDYAPSIRALVLITPALRVRLYVPLAVPALRLLERFRGMAFIKSYVRARMLTHDEEMATEYSSDPLISRSIGVTVLLGMHDAGKRLVDDAGAIHVPTLILSGGSDWVVRLSAQRRFFQRLSSPVKRMVVYPGMFHDVLHEQDRHQPIGRMREFIREAFDRMPHVPQLLTADQMGPSKSRLDSLSHPLPVWHPKSLSNTMLRGLVHTVGRLSEGIRIGLRTGFNSGESLDHVYQNRARGFTPLGRWIDRLYLNSAGWRGIRQRSEHLQRAIEQAIRALLDAGNPVEILDVASGPGRYLLETLEKFQGEEINAALRDIDEVGLAAGRLIAEQRGLRSVKFQWGDAFDESELAERIPRPNIAIVSGLCELCPTNAPILRLLRGLSRCLVDGGYLIYTNQPWHPQLELIARTLCHRDGTPWIMRCRSQVEMDQLIQSVGFEKVQTQIGDLGIFTVSMARRAAVDLAISVPDATASAERVA